MNNTMSLPTNTIHKHVSSVLILNNWTPGVDFIMRSMPPYNKLWQEDKDIYITNMISTTTR